MDPNAVILDISSDEEVDPNIAFDPFVGVDKGFIGDFDWIKEFFYGDDVVEERADDSDDLVFVGEVLSNSKQKLKSSVGKPADDDDCVVLEGDPDNLVTIQNDTTSDSDDVLVVGQKGQVACRDFPHPRHLCANFPFASTPHERHCNRCHCYVCESPAPCLKWGTGISNIDHCHATDKDEFWKVQKKSFRNSNKSPHPVSGVNSTSPAVGVRQMNPNYPVPPLFSFTNPVAQSQACRPTPIHQGTASTNFSMLSTVNPGRTQESGYVVPRHQFQSHLISQQLLSTSNRKIPRDRINNVSNLGAQFNSPRAVFKRTRSVGLGSTTTHCAYSANNYGSQHRGNAPSGTPDNGNSIRYEVLCSLMATPSTTQWISSKPMNDGIATTFVPSLQNMRSEPASSMCSQPQASSMCSQPQASSLCSQPQLSSEPQLSLQSNMGNLENWVPSLPQESLQSCVVLPLPQESVQSYGVSPPTQNSSQWYSVPSPHKESSQPSVGSMFINSPSQHLASSCSNASNIPASSAPCQPPVRSQSSHPLPNCNQNIFQLGIQTPRWATTTARQSNQRPPVEMSQLQSAEPTDENPFLGDCDTQYNYNGDIGSSSLYLEIENWLWDNQPVTVGAETSLHSGLMLSPEPDLPIDAGILYYF